jgi:hypothetical protein
MLEETLTFEVGIEACTHVSGVGFVQKPTILTTLPFKSSKISRMSQN